MKKRTPEELIAFVKKYNPHSTMTPAQAAYMLEVMNQFERQMMQPLPMFTSIVDPTPKLHKEVYSYNDVASHVDAMMNQIYQNLGIPKVVFQGRPDREEVPTAENLIDLAETITKSKGVTRFIGDELAVSRAKLALDLNAKSPAFRIRAMVERWDLQRLIKEMY